MPEPAAGRGDHSLPKAANGTGGKARTTGKKKAAERTERTPLDEALDLLAASTCTGKEQPSEAELLDRCECMIQ